jgi:glycerol-3-phosphate cytidylyltransferase
MQTVAYCGGTFDLLHPGHIRFFHWCACNFDEVVAVVNRDEFAGRYKQAPVQCLPERIEMLESCRYIDRVVVNKGDEDSTKTILEVQPTHVVNGSDWDRERLMRQMGLTQEFLDRNKIKIVLCPLSRHFSTTELKERVRTQK